jgi:methylase of polypeptide subunit release factors
MQPMNKTLSKIINKYETQTIENALVQVYIEENNIVVKNNILAKKILSDSSKEVISAKRELQVIFQSRELSDFVNVFELLVPNKDKKINGAFFTPKLVTDYIVNETVKDPNQKICDPSCGCGAFLISVAKYISEKFNKSVISTIEENLFGVDIADYSVQRAKILLTLLALKNKEDKKEIKFNLKTENSLSSDWSKIFNTQFDVVIGNPPYVKFQDLDNELRKKLNTDWKTLNTGNFNLYFAFFELGIKIMKKNGVLAYITPNNYFTSLAAVPLREYLESNKLIDKILDFNHLKLFEAQTYTCITFLKWSTRDYFDYERVDHYETLNSLGNLQFSKIFFKDLNNKKWRLLKQIDQKNIKKIETIGEKLGNVVDIRVGVATCKDSVYFIDGSILEKGFYFKEYNGEKYKIEQESTKPIAKISDFKIQGELDNNFRRIIFPYEKNNGKIEIIKEEIFKKRYPHCYKYLLAAKEELGTRDKGNIEYPTWYAYARTQGLNFFGEKLLTPTFSSEPRFLLEKDENSLFCNGYAIYLINKRDLFTQEKQKLDLNILGKILNSCVMDYYIKRTSVSIEGGYPCYQKNFIELFGIPDFSDKEIEFLEKESNKKEIDKFLIKKYGVDI